VKLYLDDIRDTPEGWVRCFWPEEVINFLVKNPGEVSDISLDHDLGEIDGRTGYDVVLWIQEQVFLGLWAHEIPNIVCHSDNGPGRQGIQTGIEAIHRYRERARL
jgi:hypothetical protein